jgi:hypothetical protein
MELPLYSFFFGDFRAVLVALLVTTRPLLPLRRSTHREWVDG